LKETGVDGVMSSEGILENPALFANLLPDPDQMALEYLEYAKKYKAEFKEIKAHMMKFVYRAIQENDELIK
jgi:tRNA-dihydrouridine synthase 1